MPAPPPVAFATLATALPSRAYITGITPTTLSNHLALQHPEAHISIADAQSLQVVDTLSGHSAPVTKVLCDSGSIWSSAKDASIIRWDERSRTPASTIKAFVRKPLPLLAMAVSTSDNLVIGGSELVSSEAHILYWDVRNAKEPAYIHSSTHSNDITSLTVLPPTGEWLAPKTTSDGPLPGRLLLSTGTDGCIALSDLREVDEEEAVHAEHSFDQASIADAGAYVWKGGMRVWARTDMNAMGVCAIATGEGADDGLEFRDFKETAAGQFMARDFDTPGSGPNVVRAPMEPRAYATRLRTEYLIDVCPSLGVGSGGAPMVGAGTNTGDIVLLHEGKKEAYSPSAFLLSGPEARGHKDVVRCMYYAVRDEAVYTGSEDGVLAGWSLASLPRLVTGDAEVDDDGGDGREEVDSEDEESEIETEESESSEESDRSDGGMDMDEDGEEEDKVTPVYGGGKSRREERRKKRHAPY